MRADPAAFALLLLPALFTGCAGADSGWRGTVETLPNGARHVRNPATGVWEEAEEWRLEPELRIGRVEGAGADVLGRVAALAVDDQGRIWMLEGQSNEVRVFGEDGAHVRTFGRAGGGPGEFSRANALLFGPEGDLWIPDAGNRRYARWDTTGVERGSVSMDPNAARFLFMGGMTADGTLFDVDVLPAEEGGQPVSPLMAAAGLGGGRQVLRAALRTDGGPVPGAGVRIPAPPAPPEMFTAERMMLGVPFTPRVQWLLDPAGAFWWGWSAEYRVVRETLSGDTTLIIEREHVPARVSTEDVEAWLASRGPQTLIQAGGSIDRSRIPSTHPVFEDLLVDDSGHLWVRLVTGSDHVAYDVFAPEGRYLGAVRSAERIELRPRPVVIGNAFYGVVRDELDVPYVVRFRIAGR